ncbi:NFATC2-interacting protein isoform X1 [Synchiropus splendidus]|uniref:NFATC2-interacting protein isoform X1 n=2 Tax=Synchiropus splendidus TaxID=270530 RepID=UPI00237D7F41|nr:NFATC2-interacting protein isoform X1 [Synchiropus splendidus]
MAEAMSTSSNVPPPKRRRILDPSTVVPVQIYSNKVGRRLQLKLPAPVFSHIAPIDADQGPLLHPSTKDVAVVIDSDEEDLQLRSLQTKSHEPAAVHCPSPPSESPVQKQSTKVKKKLIEINRKLEAFTSSPPPEVRTRTRRQQRQPRSPTEEEDDDIIVVGSGTPPSTDVPLPREIPLKIRSRTNVHKVPVLPTTPLRDVIQQLSILLQVPAVRLLLLRKEVELPADATVADLGLSIADIIDCVIMATEKGKSSSCSSINSSDSITIRLQGNDRNSLQDFTVHRDAPLDSVFSQYVSSLPAKLRKKVRFHLDGSRVKGSATAAALDLEDGDIIEVWT